MYLVEEMKNIFICPTMLQCRTKIDVVLIPLYVQTWVQEGMNKNKKKHDFCITSIPLQPQVNTHEYRQMKASIAVVMYPTPRALDTMI